MRWYTTWLLRGVVGLLLGAVTAEAAFRALDPPPRIQVVRPSTSLRLSVEDGVPMWADTDPAWRALRGEDCVPDGPPGAHVVLVGDSVFQTTGASATDNLGHLLQQRLGPGWCVHNLAQAAFSAQQKDTAARWAIARWRPALVVWEVWGEHGDFVPVGPAFVNAFGRHRDASGLPVIAAVPLPTPVNRFLLERSRAYAYTVYALAGGGPETSMLPYLDATADAAARAGARLALAYVPELSRPFGSPPETVREVHAEVRAWAQPRGLAQLDVGAALAARGADHEALRLDTCCHYRPAGHVALADVLEPWIRTLVSGP